MTTYYKEGKMRKSIFTVLLAVIAAYFVIGSAPIAAQDNGGRRPLICSPPASAGYKMDKVRNTWGETDEIESLGSDETGLRKELWTYKVKPLSLFSQNDFVTRNQYLVFVGKNLVKVSSSREEVLKEYGPVQKDINP
jgi:hypothetical protein